MTVVYEIVDETEWRKTNPLRYAHNGLFAVGVSVDDACELLDEAKAEVKEIRSALGDDGRRTHKEILELATKASQWREWKEKYIDLKNAHIAEGQDPDGTIWEHADKLQKELKEAKAEVERLRSQLERAVEIAEEFWNNQKQAITVYHEELADELDQLKATMNHDKK